VLNIFYLQSWSSMYKKYKTDVFLNSLFVYLVLKIPMKFKMLPRFCYWFENSMKKFLGFFLQILVDLIRFLDLKRWQQFLSSIPQWLGVIAIPPQFSPRQCLASNNSLVHSNIQIKSIVVGKRTETKSCIPPREATSIKDPNCSHSVRRRFTGWTCAEKRQ